MTRGILMYAHNNTEIDYFNIACTNALMIKKNLEVSVTIVTDSGTLAWSKQTLSDDFINKCFDNVIVVDRVYDFKNTRNFADTAYNTKQLQFYNCNHWQAYDLSPYDETLFIDCDYLIMSPILNNCWGSLNDVMVSSRIYSPIDVVQPYTKTVDHLGIKLYWATVIYFKKSSLAEHMFSLMRHVQENYSYFKDLYLFSNGMFRNDYAVSIAIHMLNGYNDTRPVVIDLPIPGLLMSWDTDDIYAINGMNNITVYAERAEDKGSFILSNIKDTDIHIMNKWALVRSSNRLKELYE